MAPRIPVQNARFINPERESERGRAGLEALRGYAGAPSQASVMRHGETEAYDQGELAGMAEALIPGAAMAKMPLMGILSAIKRLRHGGTYIPGSRIRDVLYAAEDPAFASSYVEPSRMPGSKLVEFDAYLRKAADRELIEQRAKELGIDNEYYTPASIFDRNLHDEYAVKKLIKSLTDDEYDHAILDDIPMGPVEGVNDTRATILFPNAFTKMPKGEYAKGGEVKTPRIPKRNARFIDTEGETNRGMSALEALRGYFGAPSQASVMVPGALSAYEGGELAGMAEMLIPGASMAKGALGAALAGVIKHRGGNWIPGDVESSISNLLRREYSTESVQQQRDTLEFARRRGYDDEMIRELERAVQQREAPNVLNSWIEGPLTKYIKRDMATPEDPVRRLADEGILHMGIPQAAGVPSTYIRNLRVDAGFPQEGLSETPGGSLWENLSDRVVSSGQAKYLQEEPKMMAENPWMQKLDPESAVYGMQSSIERGLGFDHLIDELGNAMNPGSGLPRNLLLRPEQMQQMGMEKAVRHVDAINKWRAAQQAQANAELANKAMVLREYPDTPEMPNPKGLRWVELKAPDGTNSAYLGRREYEDPAANELAKQLKYEGDTMGHCVGGYCPDVLEGRSRIFSLRDAKGEPHVTIETRPMDAENLGIVDIENVLGKKLTSDLFDEYESQPSGTGLHEFLMKFHPDVLEKLGMGENSLAIHQIKGKQNLAPKDDYLPFVQDFVRNSPLGTSKWGNVGDLRNTGLRKVGDKYVTLDELKNTPKTADGFPIGYEPLDDLPGWKDGGVVEFPKITPKAMLNRVISAYNAL